LQLTYLCFEFTNPPLLRRDRFIAPRDVTGAFLGQLLDPAAHGRIAHPKCLAGNADAHAIIKYLTGSFYLEFRRKSWSVHKIPLSGRMFT
jgi:hypothetical protein